MDTATLVSRLRTAHTHNSLRALAKSCNVSHECLRKIINGNGSENLTIATYNKISAGLVTYEH